MMKPGINNFMKTDDDILNQREMLLICTGMSQILMLQHFWLE